LLGFIFYLKNQASRPQLNEYAIKEYRRYF